VTAPTQASFRLLVLDQLAQLSETEEPDPAMRIHEWMYRIGAELHPPGKLHRGVTLGGNSKPKRTRTPLQTLDGVAKKHAKSKGKR
jgi:hypothetical protein